MTVGKILGIPENRRSYADGTRLVLAKCLTGIEFECENVKAALPEAEEGSWSGVWASHRDNSLRENGVEFVLHEPLFGQDLVDAVTWFCDQAKKKKWEANYRTGLHVHVDCRNLELNQLIAMVIYYALYEKVLFNWVGDNREGSIFCLPFYKADGVVDIIASAFSGDKGVMRDKLPDGDTRYAAFNLNALAKFGSVEWRHLQTTFDVDRIFKWVNCAQAFKKYAKHNPITPTELLGKLSLLGPYQLLQEIVGRPFAAELWYGAAEGDVWKYGVPVAHDLAVSLDSKNSSQWDTLRSALKEGTNLGFSKWAETTKKKDELKKLERPGDVLNDPELAHNPEAQAQALREIHTLLRQTLDANHLI